MKRFFLTYYSGIIYFLTFNMAIASLTIVLHEFGHYYIGLLFNCQGKIVLFEPLKGTYTALSCTKNVKEDILASGAFIFTFPLALILASARNIPERYFSLVILGLTLSTASLDMVKIFKIPLLQIPFHIIGMLLILRGEIKLVEEKVLEIEEIERSIIY